MKKYLISCSLSISLFLFTCSAFSSKQIDKNEWELLREKVEGRLIQVVSPFKQPISQELKEELQNPFAIQEYPWGLESFGWLNAWQLEASPYAVAAKNTQDIVAAIKFAKKHSIKLVVKGTGHDYLGRSNGSSDSLLLWTHHMRDVTLHDLFIPQGAPSTEKGIFAVTVQAGARWMEVYREVMVKQGRYVQGGGCTSVGVAGGFLQGGGFGSFSKKYGIAAASLLEAEVVTASGEILIANSFQNQDLFWALKGGGGGTFGVVSKVTLQTHELPKFLGTLGGKVVAHSDEAFEDLIAYFLHFYRESLNNEHWGEQVILKPDRSLDLHLAFQGLSQMEAEKVFQPFKKWVEEQPNLYQMKLNFTVASGKDAWSYEYLFANAPQVIIPHRQGKEGMFYWAGDQSQVMAYWYTMQSRWLPLSLFEGEVSKNFAKTLFKASKEWSVALHFNKGLAGGSKEAIERSQNTSIHPSALKSAALAILGTYQSNAFPTQAKDQEIGKRAVQKIKTAIKIISEVAPNAGAYSNEADYFQENWQQAFWGDNYKRLLQIKTKYDPENFFKCHHSVGSEF